MRTRTIKRVVDALQTQGRVIIWLVDCTHKISITAPQLAAVNDRDYLTKITQAGVIDCPFCEDAPPEVVRQEKPAHQLWKEAGEP